MKRNECVSVLDRTYSRAAGRRIYQIRLTACGDISGDSTRITFRRQIRSTSISNQFNKNQHRQKKKKKRRVMAHNRQDIKLQKVTAAKPQNVLWCLPSIYSIVLYMADWVMPPAPLQRISLPIIACTAAASLFLFLSIDKEINKEIRKIQGKKSQDFPLQRRLNGVPCGPSFR